MINCKKKKTGKKVVSIVIVTIWIISLGLADSFRSPLPVEEFMLQMESAGFAVEDRTQLNEFAEIHLIADDGMFTVEFVVYETASDARDAFRQFRSELEEIGEILAFLWSSSGFNSWYSQTTADGETARMSRIRSTIVLINSRVEHEDKVAEIWELLGQLD